MQIRGFAVATVLGRWAWGRFVRRPLDSFAIFCAATASLIIIINAAFMQTGSRAAPYFANPASSTAAAEASPANVAPPATRLVDPMSTNSVTPLQAQQAVPLPVPSPRRRDDPIADLLAPSPRIIAVQRVLSEFGYGQIKPSGTLDTATTTAIAKFERDHKLPVSGRVSERLLSTLGAMAGHPIE